MVEHGATILASAQPARREIEAQTSIKRGYLNVLHAREAIVAAMRPRPATWSVADADRAAAAPPDAELDAVGVGDVADGRLDHTACSGILDRHHKCLVVRATGGSMRCPHCGDRDTGSSTRATSTSRRRSAAAASAPACTTRFTTYERVEAARLVVVKRDGTRQEFDRDKLADGPAQGADPPAGAGRRRRARPPTRSRPSCARRA